MNAEADELDLIEQGLIKLFESCGHKLRNVVFSALPPMTSDFDLIMSGDDQAKWLSDPNFTDCHRARVSNPDLRPKYPCKYRRLRALDGVEDVVKNLRLYACLGIPAIRRGEVSFWALSCLPAYKNPDVTLFLRVNVYWQEVLTIFRERNTGLDFVSLHVARDPIERDIQLRDAFPNLDITDQSYVPGGHDQINLVAPCRELSALLDRDSVRAAVRLFNYRLMKKGACNFGRNHCLDLADEMVGD